jgi:uncharacterized protein YprB with RNaseH-like and TPR domain
MSYSSCLNGGGARRLNGRKFYLVEKPFESIDSGSIQRYIQEALPKLQILRREGILEKKGLPVTKKGMLFWDLETSGLGNDPIISIASAHETRNGQLVAQCCFARDYLEERSIIAHFLRTQKHYQHVFTYNGSSFDLPRLDARIIQTGLYNGKSLKDNLNGRHEDLYRKGISMGMINPRDAALAKLEKTLFGFAREDDIASGEIPLAYYEYVYGRERNIRKIPTNRKLLDLCKEEVVLKGFPEVEKENKQARRMRLSKEALRIYFDRSVQGEFKTEFFPGKRICEKERIRDMEKLINHNLIDVVSTFAVYLYLVTGFKPKDSYNEDEVPF